MSTFCLLLVALALVLLASPPCEADGSLDVAAARALLGAVPGLALGTGDSPQDPYHLLMTLAREAPQGDGLLSAPKLLQTLQGQVAPEVALGERSITGEDWPAQAADCVLVNICRVQDGDTKEKCLREVTIPQRIDNGPGRQYRLCGTMQHAGDSVHQGHYTATVWYEGSWWLLDDGNAHPTSTPPGPQVIEVGSAAASGVIAHS